MKIPAAATGRTDLYMFDPFQLVIIGYDTDDGPEHELWSYRVPQLKTERINGAMVRNVLANGVHTPIAVVREKTADGGERVLVKLGRHRVIWARAASKLSHEQGGPMIKVRGYYLGGDKKTSAGLIMSENEARVASETLIKARDAERLVEQFAYSIEECAKQFVTTTATIKNWLQLLKADSRVLDAVESGTINASVALGISKLPKEAQLTELATAIASGSSAREVTERVSARANGKAIEKDPGTKRPSMAAIRKALKYLETHADALDPKAYQMLRWVAGEVDERSIKGLTEVLRGGKD